MDVPVWSHAHESPACSGLLVDDPPCGVAGIQRERRRIGFPMRARKLDRGASEADPRALEVVEIHAQRRAREV